MENQLKTQRRRNPGPNRPFVNRENELALIKKKLKKIEKNGSVKSNVICFWGALGMGKSWLLGELDRLYKKNLTDKTITARLDLDREQNPALWENNQFDRQRLLRELWKQFLEQTGESDQLPELDKVSPEAYADAFVRQTTTWATKQQYKPIILLDTVDDLLNYNRATFRWLEENLVERLAMTGLVLFVFASRGELRDWQRFQVRRRVELYQLTPLSQDNSMVAVKADPELSKALYAHTFGHPLANDCLATYIQDRERGIYNLDEVAQRTLAQIVEELLAGLPEHKYTGVSLPELTLRFSILRWLDAEIIKDLVERWHDHNPEDERHGDNYYLKITDELLDNHLTTWDASRKSYTFIPTLRNLFMHYLELSDSDILCQAHQRAFDFHRDHLQKYPQYLANHVPELIYHLIYLKRCAEKNTDLPTVLNWWEDFKGYASTSLKPWQELKDTIEYDEDLKELLTSEVLKKIVSDIVSRCNHPSNQPEE